MQIVLREFGLSRPLPIAENEVLPLRERLRGMADVVYDLDGVKLKARAHVGHIPVKDDLDLIVTPKITNFKDFFYVLEKTAMTPKIWPDSSVLAGVEESERQDPLLFLVKVLLSKLRLIKRDGFYRKSLSHTETRSGVKGKVNLTHTLRHSVIHGLPHHVHCTYFEPTLDITENRFIKYTIRRLLEARGLPRPVRRDLRELWRVFTGVSMNITEHSQREVRSIIRQRRLPSSRAYYMDILSLCCLIVEHSTVVFEATGDVRVSAFAVNTNDMFENYIRAILTEALQPEYNVLDGNTDKQKLFTNSEHPKITPDVMIYDNSKCLIVADTKYKDKVLPGAEDWYQAIAYALALDTPSSILIYSTNEPRPPQCFQMHSKAIWVYYFPVSNLKQHEDELIAFLRQRIHERLLSP